MNKQDILNQIEWHLEETEGENASGTFDQGYKEGCYHCEALIEQLDEPKKVKVPLKAAEMIKEGVDLRASKFEIITNAVSFANSIANDEFSKWFNDHEDTFIKAVANGYEVEEEPKWIVRIGKVYLTGNQSYSFCKEDATPFEIEKFADEAAEKTGGTVEKV